MARVDSHSEAHAWLCTAYHEAGHAVAILLLGRTLYRVELIDRRSGVTWSDDSYDRFIELVEQANRDGRVTSELLRYWLDSFWILDAGAIAEAEFNLVPDEVLTGGALGDHMMKLLLIPSSGEDDFLETYYYRNVGAWVERITQACQIFFRQTRVSTLTRTLAEALLRSRRLSGEAVLDTLLANHAELTGQRDLFWVPQNNDDLFVHSEAVIRSAQMRLF